jgi:hypothetical protein
VASPVPKTAVRTRVDRSRWLQIAFIAKAGSLFTTLKWTMAAVSMLLMLFGLIMLVVKSLRK